MEAAVRYRCNVFNFLLFIFLAATLFEVNVNIFICFRKLFQGLGGDMLSPFCMSLFRAWDVRCSSLSINCFGDLETCR